MPETRVHAGSASMASDPPSIIAIDGPAASGKSTVGQRLADALGYLFFDTGVMYRAVTWLALERQLDINDQAAVERLARETRIDVLPPSQPDGRLTDVRIDGQDVTWQIRGRKVDANVSQVSAYRGVRLALTEHQRRVGLRGRVVMVGRDIGTVVLPEADLKIYLVASAEERARRRHDEIEARGDSADYAEILTKVHERDRIDSTRELAPLALASDAITLDSDHLTAEQVLARILEMCK
jgi:cytidylate kinase